LITQILPLSELKGILINPGLVDANSMVAMVGNLNNLPTPRTAIINSRQHRNPHADDPWLSATITALENAITSNSTIVSSVGMTTWEWVVWNTNRLGGYQIIVLPRGKISDFSNRVSNFIQEFDLAANKTVFLMPFLSGHAPRKRLTYPERDRWVIALSHCILPVSIRPNGIFFKLLNEPEVVSHRDSSFGITTAKTTDSEKEFKDFLSGDIPFSSVANLMIDSEWDYLTHWTRRCHGPWAGERTSDYYQDLFQTKTGDPRDGLNTLKRILQESCIRGSSRLVRGNIPLVSFTKKSPKELLEIISWRPGFIRWNFEPCGISIRRQTLESLGARPVIYGSEYRYAQLPDRDKPFFQPIESSGKDWSIEEEWRLPGDLNLNMIHKEDAIVWVMNSSEVLEIQKVSRFLVHGMATK
jgi:hypothetical protein